MSGEGPESIPTSADPRSKRPTKKRALTPVSAQAASVDALFAKPEQEIRIPSTGLTSSRARHLAAASAPPEIVANVQGSSAGAGSGEFHVYKAARRREYERLRQMDDEVRRERAAEDFERTKEERERRDDDKTRRNREKRDKMKARKAKAKGGPAAGAAGTAGGGKPPAPKFARAGGPRVVDLRRGEGKGEDGGEDGDEETAGDGAGQETPGIVIEED